jgi:hypothetical protein
MLNSILSLWWCQLKKPNAEFCTHYCGFKWRVLECGIPFLHCGFDEQTAKLNSFRLLWHILSYSGYIYSWSIALFICSFQHLSIFSDSIHGITCLNASFVWYPSTEEAQGSLEVRM